MVVAPTHVSFLFCVLILKTTRGVWEQQNPMGTLGTRSGPGLGQSVICGGPTSVLPAPEGQERKLREYGTRGLQDRNQNLLALAGWGGTWTKRLGHLGNPSVKLSVLPLPEIAVFRGYRGSTQLRKMNLPLSDSSGQSNSPSCMLATLIKHLLCAREGRGGLLTPLLHRK